MCCLRKLIQPVFPFNTEGLLNLDNDVLVFSGASSEEIAAELIPGVFSLGKARQSHCTSSGLLSSGEGRLLFRLHSNEQGREKETAAAHRWLRHHILHSPLQHHQADDEKKRRGCRQGLPQLLCQTFPYFSIRAYFLILCCEISLMGKSFCFSFEDIAEVSVPRSSTIQILLRNGGWMTLYSHKAEKIRNMIERYCVEAAQGGHEYVRAVADYVTREATLLSFRENDIIRVVKNRNLHLDKVRNSSNVNSTEPTALFKWYLKDLTPDSTIWICQRVLLNQNGAKWQLTRLMPVANSPVGMSAAPER
ncbi:hypothetical protein AVEN_259857-3 [Araneus ventricosus]|uniref:Uncharacterized protein n=1 Tax=Araneus ventricosus TaxID=182803 RepID=A0A4Y2DR21_ARAVE|nr:hypothetical protein AVEN_259857-3 [Araneus ventricosus]